MATVSWRKEPGQIYTRKVGPGSFCDQIGPGARASNFANSRMTSSPQQSEQMPLFHSKMLSYANMPYAHRSLAECSALFLQRLQFEQFAFLAVGSSWNFGMHAILLPLELRHEVSLR